ncbi:chromate efflux transporter [Pelagibacterium halotolerans]|uniref:Chromate transport protein ChrA n=1 Tax=Pelagibacterium halotolerans (strain DSM 22347 / JCM 15775 / CGMCC 1.7692 / B2) TaxID=1082931 RepID=G4RAT2_PELHB|nr:chromate efflux transporter [Pelagibacterium halotolerans]AEQ52600.1 chromate transport protein ChrA [Pelagibacterium halotolerans B2]QJR17688.1 chromate efflux transporter [Pelagibacterium halotolerans]SEA41161.1 chromate transporter [Pelagibacterium halotolerans]
MDDQLARQASRPAPFPTLGEAFTVWARIGLLSFGGPAGQIALMHRVLVEEKKWLGEQRFLHALNFCMLLPGPEAQQLAVYIGWLMHRTLGGFIAGLLFVLPGILAIMVLSWVYALYGNVGFVEALFDGLKAAVLAIVVHAVVRIGRRALRSNVMIAVAALSFIAIFAFAIPFPLIIAAAGLAGYLGHRVGVSGFAGGAGHGSAGRTTIADADTVLGESTPEHARVDATWAIRISAILILLWLTPTLVLVAVAGWDNVFTAIALFFSQMAVVTFGGAYAVLAYVAQEAVQNYGWLAPGEMLDGLGMAETTPGPLIMVTQFVGFMGAFRDPGTMHPLLAGTLGGLLTTWVTFTPCFLWIFLGAPFVERLRENRALAAALSTITAAVVGVVLNLAVWFGMHVIFREVKTFTGFGFTIDIPVWSTIDVIAAVLVGASLVAAFRFKVGVISLLLGAGGAGMLAYAVTGA